jgi:glycosyltransferase involved in cell wall biosynthesis
MARENILIEAFATYLKRVLGDACSDWIDVIDDDEQPISREAHIAVVVGERSRRTMRRLGRRSGLTRRFSNWDADTPPEPSAIPVAIFDRFDPSAVRETPPSFDVLALVTTFNEIDIVEQLINRLRHNQIRVHVIDNWSNDGTAEVLEQFAAQDTITMERYPCKGPSEYFELEKLLQRVEELANSSGADWIVHHDADEIREPPWPDVSLRDALWAVEQWGYNCIDHTIVNFRPIDASWKAGYDLASSFAWCEFGDSPGHFLQLKAWKPQANGVMMAASGGHDAQFEGRKVFPYKFVLRHYPIRSQEHGERKILRERQERWSPAERAKGWHRHYDAFDEDSSFIWNKADLLRWNTIDRSHLLQRLSGVCLPGNPWPGEAIASKWPEHPFHDDAYRAFLEIRNRVGVKGRDAARLSPSEVCSFSVFVRNDGNEVWLRAGLNNIGLASKWFVGTNPELSGPPLEEGPRTQFSADVHPGEGREQLFSVQAPALAGHYTLVVDLVHEHVRWFGCGATLDVEVAET